MRFRFINIMEKVFDMVKSKRKEICEVIDSGQYRDTNTYINRPGLY